MFCSNCGARMSDDDKFCPECGAPIESDISAAPEQSQEQLQQPAATQQPAAVQTQKPQTAQIQPQPQMNIPAQAAVKTAKKGVKKGVIIGAACGGTALVAAGAVGIALTSTGFLHTVLGDQAYAQLVQAKYIGEVADKNKGIINTATTYAKAAGKAAGAASSLDRDQLYNSDYSYNEASAVSSAYAYMQGLDGLDTRNMSLTAGVELNVDDKLRDLIDQLPLGSNAEDFIDTSVEVANSTQIRISQRMKDDEFAVSAYVLRGGEDLAGGVAHLNKKGELYFCMPEMTDKVLKYELPAYEDLFDESLKKPDVDEKKVMEFAEKVIKKLFDSYKDAEIEYTDDSLSIGESEEKCTVITVTYENENLADLLTDLADIAEDDDYINSLFENDDNGYYYSSPVESVANTMRNLSDNLYSMDNTVSLTAETYVKGNNDPIGMKLSLRNGRDEIFKIESLDNDKDMTLKISVNGRKLVDLTDAREGNSGEMTLKVDLGAFNSYSSADMKMTFRIKYSDLTTFKAFGREMTGGKFTVSIKSIPFLERTAISSISSGNVSFMDAVRYVATNSITDLIKEGEIGFSLLPEGKGYKTTYSVGIKEYGSIGFYYILSPESNITDVNMSNVIDINDFDTDDAIDLTADVTKYILKKTGKDKEIQDLNDVIYLMTGVNVLDMLENSDDIAVNYVSRFLPSSSYSNSRGRYDDYYYGASTTTYYETTAPSTYEYYDTTRAAYDYYDTTTAAYGGNFDANDYDYANLGDADWNGDWYGGY